MLWVQAGAVEGTVTLTLSVPGLPSVTSTVTVVPAGIRVLNESPILFSASALRVAAAALDPVTRVPLAGPDQTIGPGVGGGILIRFASSDAEVADAAPTVLRQNAAGLAVVLGRRPGRAEVVVVQPEGFEPPAVFDRVQVIVP